MSNIITLTDLVTLALKHEIDHEVWYANTTNGSVRAKMILSLAGKPTVTVDFGDKKHGQRVSRATVSGSGKVKVRMEDVVESMKKNAVEGVWRTGEPETNSINVGTLTPFGEQVGVKGRIVGSPEKIDGFFFYHVKVGEYVVVQATQTIELASEQVFRMQIFERDPSPYVNSFGYHSSDAQHGQYAPRNMSAIPEDTKVDIIGTYRYPDIIEVTNIDYESK